MRRPMYLARVGSACWHPYTRIDELETLWLKAASGIPVIVKPLVSKF